MAQRPKDLTPHKSARHYWGAELRALRTERDLSLDELGRRIHRDRSSLAKIERGERSVSPDLARDCDHALQAGGSLVRLHGLISASDKQDVIQPGPHVANGGPHVANQAELLADDTPQPGTLEGSDDEFSVPARTADGKVIFVNVSRRLFLQGLGASAVGIAAGPTVPAPAAALSSREVSPVAHFEQMRRTLIDADNLFGPARVIPQVQDHVQLIQQLRHTQRGADQRALLHTQTKFAEFCGWLHQDAGNHQAAQYWMDRALQWSHGAGDPELTTFIMARKSQLAGDMIDPLEAVDAAVAAENMAAPRSRLAAIAATFGAHGHAMRGDRDATARAYDHAHHLLENLDDDLSSAWGVWLDTAYIDVARYRSLALLGDYTGAADGFQRALTALPPDFHRDKGVYLARAAHAHAGARDADQAAALGMDALIIGTETSSARILTELSQLNDSLAHSDTPRVIEFRDAMNDTIAREV